MEIMSCGLQCEIPHPLQAGVAFHIYWMWSLGKENILIAGGAAGGPDPTPTHSHPMEAQGSGLKPFSTCWEGNFSAFKVNGHAALASFTLKYLEHLTWLRVEAA